jgi:hypothetical protein
MTYLTSFIVGSSIIVSFHFLMSVMTSDPNKRNYKYKHYSILAPLYFGCMNMLSLYISKKFNFDMKTRYVITSIMSFSFVNIFARIFKMYKFTKTQWMNYHINIIIKHIFSYIIIYLLETNL